MKKSYLNKIACLCTCCLFFLSSCSQQTANVPPQWFATEDNEQLISLLGESARQPYQCPESVSLQVNNYDKPILHIQAQVQLPENENIPVLQIMPRAIEQEFVDDLVYTFVKDKPLYALDTSAEIYQLPGQAQKVLDEMQAELNNPESALNQLRDFDPTAYSEYKGRLEREIQNAQAFLNNPDNTATQITDIQFSMVDPQNDNMPYEIMWFEQQPGIICSIKLEQSDANTFQFALRRLDARAANVISTCQSNEETLPSTGKSYDQALSEAEQIVDDLNIDYMDLAFSGKGKEGFVDPYAFPNIQQDEFYVFAFTRCYNGYHEQLHCSANFGGSSYTVEEESQTWSNEYLVITIDKEGLRSVEWRSPSMLVTVENENAELAAFDDVANTLKEEGVSYLHRQQSWAGEPYMDEYNIDTIQLGLTKITDPREEGKYLLIPAWQLRGSYVIHVPQENWEGFVASYIGSINGEAMVHSIYTPEINGDIVQDLPLTNYMTINALDANIIERKWE